jgi:GNAT superfamily N-acetyltransferase
MIRPAHLDDIPRMVDLGAVMHSESPRFRDFAYQPARVGEMMEWLMGSPQGLVLVAEQPLEGVIGGIMAITMPHYACELVQANDLALFVHPEFRGGSAALRLVRGYLDWARDMGAEPSIGINTGVQPERTGKLLAALGAEQTGVIWTWGVNSCASVRG